MKLSFLYKLQLFLCRFMLVLELRVMFCLLFINKKMFLSMWYYFVNVWMYFHYLVYVRPISLTCVCPTGLGVVYGVPWWHPSNRLLGYLHQVVGHSWWQRGYVVWVQVSINLNVTFLMFILGKWEKFFSILWFFAIVMLRCFVGKNKCLIFIC